MLKLVSDNPHPTPNFAEWCEANRVPSELSAAESLQLNEQEEANGIAAFVADRIVTFIAGIAACLVSEIVILLIVKGVF